MKFPTQVFLVAWIPFFTGCLMLISGNQRLAVYQFTGAGVALLVIGVAYVAFRIRSRT